MYRYLDIPSEQLLLQNNQEDFFNNRCFLTIQFPRFAFHHLFYIYEVHKPIHSEALKVYMQIAKQIFSSPIPHQRPNFSP